MKFFKRGAEIIDGINDTIGSMVAFLAIPMMLAVVYEVIARYIFNSPTIWSMEINQHLLCAYTALAGGYALLHKAHVSVDILYERFPLNIRVFVNFITSIMGFIFLYILFVKSLDIAIEAWKYKEQSDSLFAPYLFPVKVTIPIGALLFAFQLLAKLIRDIEELIIFFKKDAGASSKAGE
jgi:TRAP-type mannitol/chloroaromatic compound transport system permease small subunit